jgi:hypothetical protein
MAIPLVCTGVIAAGADTACDAATVDETAFPQAVQNFSFADRLLPQPEQIIRHDLPFFSAKPR